jgi:transcriptional regulator with XRE-family HTH domain
MTDRALVAFNVRRLRVAKGLSQSGLGALTHLSQTTISDIERGLWVSTNRLDAIAEALHVETAELTRRMSPSEMLKISLSRPRRQIAV